MNDCLSKLSIPVVFLCSCIHLITGQEDAGPEVSIQGFGWIQAGTVGRSTDSVNYNFNGNWIQNAAAQVTAHAVIDEHLEGAMGIGVGQDHKMQGRASDAAQLDMDIPAYLTEARFTYLFGEKEKLYLRMDFGFFPFNYNPQIKNLGLYLLRGPVYPGILMSGFETKEMLPIGNVLGFHIGNRLGNFKHDLILNSETELRPFFDFSLAYIGKYSFGKVLEIGGGVNFYHLIPITKEYTDPRNPGLFTIKRQNSITQPYDRDFCYVKTDTLLLDAGNNILPGQPVLPAGNDSFVVDDKMVVVSKDTTWYTHRGTKLAAFFSFDPKPLFGLDNLGASDLFLYGEVGLIGVKNYPVFYNDISQRIPVMVGFNLPAFGILDNLSLELEWYGAKFKNDLKPLMNENSPLPTSSGNHEYQPEQYIDTTGAAPDTSTVLKFKRTVYPEIAWGDPYDLENLTSDDWKWSLHAAKTIQGHFRISAQVANDHFRPSGTGVAATYWEILTTSKDWYWMLKLLYFF